MFELPEYVILAGQFNEALRGKIVQTGSLGNSPHKFVWYNREPEEFARLVAGRTVGTTSTRGRWLFTPLEAAFTFEYFSGLIDELLRGKKRSVKALLTQDQLLPGLGNAIAQDILFSARLHPRHALSDLSREQRRALCAAITETVRAVIAAGGRYDEVDLYGRTGGYVRLMDQNALKRPCPVCGGPIQKIQYLGGACYLCPHCQQ